MLAFVVFLVFLGLSNGHPTLKPTSDIDYYDTEDTPNSPGIKWGDYYALNHQASMMKEFWTGITAELNTQYAEHETKIKRLIEENVMIQFPDSKKRSLENIYDLYSTMRNYNNKDELKKNTSILDDANMHLSNCVLKMDDTVLRFDNYWTTFFTDYFVEYYAFANSFLTCITTNATFNACYQKQGDVIRRLFTTINNATTDFSNEIARTNEEINKLESCSDDYDMKALQEMRNAVGNEIKSYFEKTQQTILPPNQDACANNPLCVRSVVNELKQATKNRVEEVLNEFESLFQERFKSFQEMKRELDLKIVRTKYALVSIRLPDSYYEHKSLEMSVRLQDCLKTYEHLDEAKNNVKQIKQIQSKIVPCIEKIVLSERRHRFLNDFTLSYDMLHVQHEIAQCQKMILEVDRTLEPCFQKAQENANKLFAAEKENLESKYLEHEKIIKEKMASKCLITSHDLLPYLQMIDVLQRDIHDHSVHEPKCAFFDEYKDSKLSQFNEL